MDVVLAADDDQERADPKDKCGESDQRAAQAGKLGWSPTISTVLPMAVILAHGRLHIHRASRTRRGAIRTPRGGRPTLPDASYPPGCRVLPLGVWRHVRNPIQRRIDHE